MSSVNDKILKLLEMPILDEENNVSFSKEARELIHEIAEDCKGNEVIRKNQEKAKKYADGLSAEDVYVDMMYKIIEAPTKIHMIMSAKMLIPVIDKKLEEEACMDS